MLNCNVRNGDEPPLLHFVATRRCNGEEEKDRDEFKDKDNINNAVDSAQNDTQEGMPNPGVNSSGAGDNHSA